MDDQPVWLRTRAGRLLSVPYPQELNDANAVVLRQTTGADFADMIVAQFDEMNEHGSDQALVLGIALHAHVSGQPFRLRALRQALRHIAARRDKVWLTDTDRIAAAWPWRYAASSMVDRKPATVVRCMSRTSVGSNGRPRCIVAWLSQITRSNGFQACA